MTTLLSFISTPRLVASHYFLRRIDVFGLLIGPRVDIAFEIFRRERKERFADLSPEMCGQ